MTDIVERLRTRNGRADGFGLGPVCDEAADEIERLRAALAAPPVAPGWVPLTDEQINQITAAQWGAGLGAPYAAYRAYARAIEAAHGITAKEAP